MPKLTKTAKVAASNGASSAESQSASSRKPNTPHTKGSAKRNDLDPPVQVAEMLATQYHGVSLYSVAMLVLVMGILWTGVKVVEQIQTYHQQYGVLLQLKREFRQLQIEHQRMLIEQQTFSSTPQVLNRATTELSMFYPNLADRMILHANQATQTSSPSQPLATPTLRANPVAPAVQP